MKTILLLTIGLLAAAPASAAVIDVKFSGTLKSQSGIVPPVASGPAVSGGFVYDTTSSTYLSFTVAGISIPAPFASLASVTPDRFTALYSAQVSAVQQGGTINRIFTLDLEGVNPFPAGSAISLLSNTALLTTGLDLASSPTSQFPSTFGFSTSDANGNNKVSLTANLVAISATTTQTAVPEPASFALLGGFLFAVSALRRRL